MGASADGIYNRCFCSCKPEPVTSCMETSLLNARVPEGTMITAPAVYKVPNESVPDRTGTCLHKHRLLCSIHKRALIHGKRNTNKLRGLRQSRAFSVPLLRTPGAHAPPPLRTSASLALTHACARQSRAYFVLSSRLTVNCLVACRVRIQASIIMFCCLPMFGFDRSSSTCVLNELRRHK